MKARFRQMTCFASLSGLLILLAWSPTGCKLDEAASEGFFDAITEVVTTVVTDILLPGD